MFTAIKKSATAVSALAVAAMIGVSAVPAEAGHRDRDGWRGSHRHAAQQRHHHRNHHRRGNGNAEAAIVGGLIGLGAAIVIGSALAQPTPPRPAPVYAGGPRPWSNDWYAYCASKYRSFNPRTGYYVTYSGDYAFCR